MGMGQTTFVGTRESSRVLSEKMERMSDEDVTPELSVLPSALVLLCSASARDMVGFQRPQVFLGGARVGVPSLASSLESRPCFCSCSLR